MTLVQNLKIRKITSIGSTLSMATVLYAVALATLPPWRNDFYALILADSTYVDLPFPFDLAMLVFIPINFPVLLLTWPALSWIRETESLSRDLRVSLGIGVCAVASAVWWTFIYWIEGAYRRR